MKSVLIEDNCKPLSEHDTFKVKSELFDEFITSVKLIADEPGEVNVKLITRLSALIGDYDELPSKINLLNPTELAAKLGCCIDTVRSWRKAGKLPPHYPNPSPGRLGWLEEDVELFLECHKSIEEYNRRK